MRAGFAASDAKWADLRRDIQAGFATVRQEAAESAVRSERQCGELRALIEKRHADTMKWALGFWIGSLAALSGLLVALGRFAG